MTTEEMAGKILEFVEGHPTTTFAELHRNLGAEMEGEYMMFLHEDLNIVLWSDVSETFSDAMNFLKDRVFIGPTMWLVYAMDGEMLRLPIAKKAKKYKTPHWIPSVISIRTPEHQALIDAHAAKKTKKEKVA